MGNFSVCVLKDTTPFTISTFDEINRGNWNACKDACCANSVHGFSNDWAFCGWIAPNGMSIEAVSVMGTAENIFLKMWEHFGCEFKRGRHDVDYHRLGYKVPASYHSLYSYQSAAPRLAV